MAVLGALAQIPQAKKKGLSRLSCLDHSASMYPQPRVLILPPKIKNKNKNKNKNQHLVNVAASTFSLISSDSYNLHNIKLSRA